MSLGKGVLLTEAQSDIFGAQLSARHLQVFEKKIQMGKNNKCDTTFNLARQMERFIVKKS